MLDQPRAKRNRLSTILAATAVVALLLAVLARTINRFPYRFIGQLSGQQIERIPSPGDDPNTHVAAYKLQADRRTVIDALRLELDMSEWDEQSGIMGHTFGNYKTGEWIRFSSRDMPNIDKEPKVTTIVITNHQSWLDNQWRTFKHWFGQN